MLPLRIRQRMQESMPAINPLIGEGLAHHQLTSKMMEDEIRAALRDIRFPEGCSFVDIIPCTPEQQYLHALSSAADNKPTYDIARSDMYCVLLRFKYQDRIIDKPYWLPIFGRGGTTHISGTQYVVNPVLSDMVMQIEGSEVVVRLSKATFKVNSDGGKFMVVQEDGTLREEPHQFYHARLHNASRDTGNNSPGSKHPLVLYLLCRWGMTEAFRRFAGIEVFAGRVNKVTLENFPADEWVITQAKGTAIGKSKVLTAPDFRVAIRKKDYTPYVCKLLAGLYHAVSYKADWADPDYVDTTPMWLRILGYFIDPDSINQPSGKVLNDMRAHIESSIDQYMDSRSLSKLRYLGITKVNDPYDLLAYIVENFEKWIARSASLTASMNGKELTCANVVTQLAVHQINNMGFKFSQAAGRMTFAVFEQALKRHLKPRGMFHMPKKLGNVTNTPTSSDNILYRRTCLLTPQQKARKETQGKNKKGNKGGVVQEAARIQLHASIAEVGQFSALPKSGPDGRERVNFYLKLSPEFVVERDPEIAELIDGIQSAHFAVKGRLARTKSASEDLVPDELKPDFDTEGGDSDSMEERPDKDDDQDTGSSED